ncbi:PTS sugar transporter subunit IIB [Enterococcus faecalis]|uniref:PTS sugar transporter subunit IIB n=13 Tax=Enterococcus faecalis TaxID=1351 RepID=UPI00045204E6|nr:PTS system IIB component [Enterococcus faecalis EnGen0426]
MAKKTIMLVCSAGMSTSLLVTKMQKAAEDRGMEADIFAVSASEADTNLENKEVNVLLLGPQVRFMVSWASRPSFSTSRMGDTAVAIIFLSDRCRLARTNRSVGMYGSHFLDLDTVCYRC